LAVNIYSSKQSQFELFPRVTQPVSPKTKRYFFLKELTLSGENIVILVVFMVIAMVLSFSVGVEQGRRKVVVKRVAPTQSVASETPTAVEPAPVVVETDPMPSVAEVPILAAQPTLVNLLEPRLIAGEQEKVANFKKDDKIYTIQVASFQKEKYANQEAEDLKKKGFEIIVLPKGKHSIVCVGKFAGHNEAKDFSKKLRTRYKDCMVRSL
jgi:cell division septation protein DedD